ncbi:hypothetical protein [Rhodoferax aquaticus]|uniref:Uncharacterized protein n=1 Tax=Rhodoferax aquaticus TaxID=2527691 RepID=A0A515ERM2_9BURK|nr:hypothetical protein [Rhodoferax aquaticus]QDL55326.1 hypothetical protein EXZ61_14745 [Rhodoferax aquaticus]
MPDQEDQNTKASESTEVAPEDAQPTGTKSSLSIEGDNNLVLVIEKMLTKLTESRLQADFYQTTGMRCSRNVRVLMEKLMEDYGFTSHELKRPWRSGALVPDRKTGGIKVASRVFDLAFGWGGVALATLLYLPLSIGLMTIPSTLQSLLGLAIASCFYVLAIFGCCYQMLWPQKTAIRVALALGAD